MKAWLAAIAVLVLSALSSSDARAQVHEGDLRLYFDTSLISYTMSRIKADSPAGDYKEKDNQLGVGTGSSLLGGGGIGIAYAASSRVIPGLYLGLQRLKLSGEVEIDDDSNESPDQTITQFELRPQLEFAFIPDSRFVPYGVGGLSYLRRSTDFDGNDSDSYGIGPVLGLGAHAFAASGVSFDFSLTFRALFVDDEDREDALKAAGGSDIKQREYAILFNLGASLWL